MTCPQKYKRALALTLTTALLVGWWLAQLLNGSMPLP
jgi:hypothetical protein